MMPTRGKTLYDWPGAEIEQSLVFSARRCRQVHECERLSGI